MLFQSNPPPPPLSGSVSGVTGQFWHPDSASYNGLKYVNVCNELTLDIALKASSCVSNSTSASPEGRLLSSYNKRMLTGFTGRKN